MYCNRVYDRPWIPEWNIRNLKPSNFANATGLSICTKLSAFSPDSMSGWQPSDAMVDLSAAGQAQLTIASPLANGMDIGYHPIFKQTQMNRNDDFVGSLGISLMKHAQLCFLVTCTANSLRKRPCWSWWRLDLVPHLWIANSGPRWGQNFGKLTQSTPRNPTKQSKKPSWCSLFLFLHGMMQVISSESSDRDATIDQLKATCIDMHQPVKNGGRLHQWPKLMWDLDLLALWDSSQKWTLDTTKGTRAVGQKSSSDRQSGIIIYIYIYVWVCVNEYVNLDIYIYISIWLYMYICIYIYSKHHSYV